MIISDSNIMKICIFGGTTEGRVLAERLAAKRKTDQEIVVSVASDYGEEMLRGISGIKVHVGRLDREKMSVFLVEGAFDIVIDATHPFATEVTGNIKFCCEKLGIRYIRLKREDEEASGSTLGKVMYFDSPDALSEKLTELIASGDEGKTNVLLTTGSKELTSFTQRIDVRHLFVRVLPTKESIDKCLEAGLTEDHIISLKGPFSVEENVAHIRKYNISYLVTKESGAGSGYLNKLKAAEAEDITTLIVRRPDDDGLTLDEILIFF